MATDIFEQVAAAKSLSGARYPYLNSLPLGDYVLEIEVLKRIEGSQDGLTKIIGEFKVVASPATTPEAQPGARVQAVYIPQRNPKARPMVLAEIKEMVAAACQMGVDDVTKEDVDEAFSVGNPTRSQKVGVKIFNKPNGFKKVQFHKLDS